MHHAALEQLCTLVGVFAKTDGGRSAMIPGTHLPAKVFRRDCMPGHPVGDVAVIELPSRCPGLGTSSKHSISLDI